MFPFFLDLLVPVLFTFFIMGVRKSLEVSSLRNCMNLIIFHIFLLLLKH